MRKPVSVKQETFDELNKLRGHYGCRSYDDVIAMLINFFMERIKEGNK